MSCNNLIVHKSVPAGISNISSLCCAVYIQVYGHVVRGSQLSLDLEEHYGKKAVEADFYHPDKDQFVAHRTGGDQRQVLGMALLSRKTDDPALGQQRDLLELERLYVAVEYQRQGIGSALMCAVEQEAENQGFRGLWLGVWEENERAIDFYRMIGFEKVGEHDWISQKDWIMVKYFKKES